MAAVSQHRRRVVENARGVSLVEALVALAVMAFGMLAIVGIQSTMRLNSDVAKQRSEAVRIAQETMERWRGFSVLAPDGVHLAYVSIASVGDEVVVGYTTNTSYTLVRTASEPAGQNHKVLQVAVNWVDRSGGAQSVVLHGVIAGIEPGLSGSVSVTPAGNPSKRPRNRHAGIPPMAQDMGNGSSAFKPPQAGGGSVAWVFNNTTGMITGLCTVSAATTNGSFVLSDIEGCSNNTLAHLLSGFVRFAGGASQPTAAEAEAPTGLVRRLDMNLVLSTPPGPSGQETQWAHPGPPECYDDAPATTADVLARTAVAYYCLIPANTKLVWAGFSTILPLAFTDDPASEWSIPFAGVPSPTHRLCRYTPALSDTQVVPNSQHPREYTVRYLDPDRGLLPIPTPPLPNQNFLVVDIAHTCPTDTAANPAIGDFINANTLEQLPLPSTP
jgi:hypothetical protein